jgi:glycosyltransferase involved in cell wall biosynthesis
MKRMKLGFVSGFFPFANREQFFEAEVTSLAEYFEIAMFETRATTKVERYPNVPGTRVYLGYLSPRVFSLALREFLRAPRAALAMLWFLLTGPCGLRARLVNLTLYPKALALANAVRSLGIEHMHVNWLTTSATIVYVASKLTGIPYSMTGHQHDIFSKNLIVPKVRDAEFVRVISERNCRHLQEQLPQALRAKCSTIHLGVKLPQAEPPAAPEGVARPVRIVCAARLCIWKGHRYLIDALVRLQARGLDFVCDFAGIDELGGEVERLVAASGLGSRVRMLGYVAHADLVRALERGDYDLSVLASTERNGEHEGIPVALMEAMAVGLPVVATRTGSIPELVDAGCGILVEQRDPAALAEAIGALIEDPALRERLGAGGRQRVFAEFETGETTRRLAKKLAESAPWYATELRPPGQKSLV